MRNFGKKNSKSSPYAPGGRLFKTTSPNTARVEPQGRKIDENAERIISAAVNVDGVIHTGRNHNEIRTRRQNDKGEIVYDYEDGKLIAPHSIGTEGFVTSLGRFVDRREAGEIAYNAGQTKEKIGWLNSYDVKM